MGYSIEAAIRAASGEIGYRESGTNRTKYNRWLGQLPGYPHNGYGYPWCASFQSWVADRAGGRAGVDYPRTAGCATAVAWFKSHNRWSSTVPHVGDWVFYGPRGTTHVELVIGVTARHITTIGGNTSGSLHGAYFNGDGVYRKTVSRSSDRIYGYGRPAYEEDDVSAEDVWNYGIDTGDGKSKWRASTVLGHLEKSQDRIEAKLDAQALVIDKLADALALAQPDIDDLKAEIRTAIEGIRIRLDATPDAEDAS